MKMSIIVLAQWGRRIISQVAESCVFVWVQDFSATYVAVPISGTRLLPVVCYTLFSSLPQRMILKARFVNDCVME